MPEASPYYAAFVEDTYHPIKTVTVTAGLRWDIFGGKTERHNRLEYFDPTATDTVSGVAFTGGEVFANSGSRSPFTTNLKDIQSTPGLLVATRETPGRSRRRRHLLWPQRAYGRRRLDGQRWLLHEYELECDLLQRR